MTFSYAQAARGILTPSNVSSNPGSSASSEKGFKDTVRENTSVETPNTTTTSSTSNSIAESKKENIAPTVSGKVEEATVQKQPEAKEVKNVNTVDEAVITHSAQPTNDTLLQKEDQSSEIHSAERAKDQKETDDDWEKVSIPSTADKDKDKELKPAPIPVNFWAQRSQTLQSKVKETPATTSKPVPSASASQRSRPTQNDDDKRRSVIYDSKNDQTVRPSSGGRASKDQQNTSVSPRSLSQNANATVQPPPIDAQFWPKPENSTVELGRRSSVRESVDKTEADLKSGGKQKWTPVPFVPTVKFETQIPGQARRGGKAATRGRGGMIQSERSEKNEPGSMGPPPLPKQVSEQDRGRKSSVVKTTRPSSLSNDEDGMATQATEKVDTTGTQTPSTQQESRSSSRQPTSQKPDFNPDLFQQNNTSPSRPYNGSKHEGTRNSQDFGDRSQNKYQKNDSWRKNERPDRGRGGMRGGRGGNHSSFSGSPFNSPLQQNGFDSKGETKSRQQSVQTFGTPYNSTRGGSRSQSIPIHMLAGNGFYQPGFAEALSPIQTSLPYQVYGQPQSAMSAGSMSAMPYSGHLNDYALVSMVVTQLEYYFSLDNLCKDMFLRKNMDSQGFVPLQVIADFRRVKALLGDPVQLESLRQMASHVRNIEIVTAEDGKDHLRSRENWKDFVLPMEERVEGSRHEGPKLKPQQHQTGYESNGLRSAPPSVNGFHDAYQGQPQMLPFRQSPMIDTQSTEQWAARVENARFEEDRRTSVTSPLGKIQSQIQETRNYDLTNGHRDSISSSIAAAQESTFPDENVAALKVVVRDPEYQGQDTPVEEIPPSRVSGLRGGAGSPEQFERIRNLQFGYSAPQPKRNQTLYTVQSEGPPPHLVKPGYIWEEYYSLRDLAKSQRAENHFDGALAPLYPLWAEFLCVPSQFNVGMYEDFKDWAVEDEPKDNGNGKRYLVKFFEMMLTNTGNAISERVASDIVEIARNESENRPTWLKIRAAWRNGATNLKTRKRISDLLTAEEKAMLDRGV